MLRNLCTLIHCPSGADPQHPRQVEVPLIVLPPASVADPQHPRQVEVTLLVLSPAAVADLQYHHQVEVHHHHRVLLAALVAEEDNIIYPIDFLKKIQYEKQNNLFGCNVCLY